MEKTGLYIHIPFCVKKCHYCDFLSYPAGEEEKKQYVELLCREIRLRSEAFRGCTVPTVFIGGGTPSCLPGEDTARIMEAVYASFAVEKTAEVTIEMNPGTVDREKLEWYRSAGVNRLSIGLQSTDDEMLRILGRIHTCGAFLECYEMAVQAGFENINVDIMSALPGQTREALTDTLYRVAELSPAHISCYSLILEEGTPFFEGRSRMVFPDEEEDREMYYLTKDILAGYGYRRYEISNYAKPGMESRHNTGYWRRADYLGLGMGASSFTAGSRYKNPAEFAVYKEMVSTGRFEEYKVEAQRLTEQEAMEEFMFLGLRMTEGIDKKVFEKTFGKAFEPVYGEKAKKLSADGLLEQEGTRLFLTDRGIDVSNYVFGQFLF